MTRQQIFHQTSFLILSLLVLSAVGIPVLQAQQNAVCPEETCFEKNRRIAGKNFFLRGVAFFKRSFADIYKVGFYTPRGVKNEKQVLAPNASKAVVVQYDRDIDVRELFNEMKENMPPGRANDQALKDQFIQIGLAVYPIHEGERHEFIYEPGQGTLLVENGEPKLRIWGEKFARIFFEFWLDRHNQGNVLLRPQGI